MNPAGAIYDRVFAGLRSQALAKALIQLVSWVGTVYVFRQLDSQAVGLFGIAIVVLNYGSLVYEGGILEALVQRPPASRSERRAVFTLLIGSGVILAGAMVALSEAVAGLVGEPGVAPLIALISLVLPLTALGLLPHAQMLRQMRFERLAVIASTQAIATTVTTVGLVHVGAGAWSLVIGMIAGIALRTLLFNVAAPNLFAPTRRMRPALGYARFGGLLIADGALWRWYTSLDTILLGRWQGASQLGFYSFAQQIANLPLEKISTIVNDISLPAFAELSSDRRAGARLMLETIRTHATVGFPVFWGFAAIAQTAVPLIFGAQWNAAVLPLIALAVVAPIRLMGSIETPAITGLGQPQVLLKTKLVIVPCMTVALFLGCWMGGINGAALVWMLVFPVCYAIAFRYVLREVSLSYGDLLRVMRGPAAASALMAGVVQGACTAAAALHLTPHLSLGAQIAVGALSYGILLRLIDPEGFGLVLERLRRLAGIRPVT